MTAAHSALLEHLGGQLFARTDDDQPVCTSPIERMLALALVAEMGAFTEIAVSSSRPADWHRRRGDEASALICDAGISLAFDPWITLLAQVGVGSFRIDLAIVGGSRRIAIECDGHEFHERTKAQAAHDKRRDRFLVRSGWSVLRFTGSEIWADPITCAREVFSIAERRQVG